MHDLEPSKVVAWLFYSVIGGGAAIALGLLNDMRKSVAKLNENVVAILADNEWYKKKFGEHDQRLEEHEDKLERNSERIVRLEERPCAHNSKRKRAVTDFGPKDS